MKYFSTREEKFRISAGPCDYPLYKIDIRVYFVDEIITFIPLHKGADGFHFPLLHLMAEVPSSLKPELQAYLTLSPWRRRPCLELRTRPLDRTTGFGHEALKERLTRKLRKIVAGRYH